jgi:hypothetical protein
MDQQQQEPTREDPRRKGYDREEAAHDALNAFGEAVQQGKHPNVREHLRERAVAAHAAAYADEKTGELARPTPAVLLGGKK